MKRPTTKANYTAEELRQYAHHRKTEAVHMVGNTLDAVRDDDTSHDEPSDYEDYREPLCLMTTKVITVQLSWGGDGDGFKLTYDTDGELLHGIYYWQDWFVYEEVELSDTEAEKVEELYNVRAYTNV